jgi:O6-methylguanine-DNA--protein-cysteine methyltransferase
MPVQFSLERIKTPTGRMVIVTTDEHWMRAVGLANGANPIAIVIPCHRVIGANASLTGYGGGLDRKRWLLQHESACSAARGESHFLT